MKEDFVLDRIEELYRKKGYTQYRLAKKSGIHQSSLSTLMNRKSTPNIFTLDKICKGLDVTIAQFFTPSEEYPDLTDEENAVLNMFDSMNDFQKALLFAYLQGMNDANASKKS